MRKMMLGGTGIKVSQLAMGAIQITRLGWDESIRMVREVMDMGITLFDTARGYFDSEMRLGEAFRGNRDKVTITTKSPAVDPRTLQLHIDESLQRLETDYIDGFFFHGADAIEKENFLTAGGMLETALDAVKAGKIRFLGFSAHNPDLAIKALDIDALKVAMIPANIISREYIDGDFMIKAREKQTGVMIMKPFGGGRIDNKRICLKYLKNYSDIIPCPGIEKSSEMAENIQLWESDEKLMPDDYLEIEKIRRQLGKFFCRGCGYCMPCPAGIEIPTVTFIKVLINNRPSLSLLNDELKKTIEDAKKCTKCRKCVAKCPYKLSIPEMLDENIRIYEKFLSQHI